MTGIEHTIGAVAERTMRWQQASYYWGDAIAYDGLIEASDLLSAGWAQAIAARLERWSARAVDAFDDALAPGAAAVKLVENGMLDVSAVTRIVAALTRLDTVEGVPLLRPNVPQWRDLIWVDSLYHVPSGLVSAGRLLGDDALIDRGIAAARGAIGLLRTSDAIGHAHDAGLGRSTGIDWTRGIGWAVLGLFDTIGLAPHAAEQAGLTAEAERLLEALHAAQRPNGRWASVLGRPDADDETSVSGFWLAAALHPVRAADADDASEHALAGLLESIDADGTVTGVSHDTHVTWSIDDYTHPATLASPWGQGAALRGLVAAARAGLG